MPFAKKKIKTAEHREDKRYPFRWPVAIVFEHSEGRDTYHGTTHELSLGGCSVLTEHNVYTQKPIALLLSAPGEHPGASRNVLEIKARMVYTVLSSGHQKFRCGIQFVNLKPSDKSKLSRAVERRALWSD